MRRSGVMVGVCACGVWLAAEARAGADPRPASKPDTALSAPAAGPTPRRRPLSDLQQRLGAAAWTYMFNNFQPTTCLINSVENFPSTTMWDVGSEIAGLLSAYDLGYATEHTLHLWLACLLDTLASLELYQGQLPNKVYHTQTLAMVGYDNQPAEVGFSALDIGRLLIWLRIVAERFPEHAPAVDAVLARWQLCDLVDACGTLYGARPGPDGLPEPVQEGRLGYEEYAARGYALWGIDVRGAAALAPFDTACIYGIDIPFDARDPRVYGAHTYVVTESNALDGIEFNWDAATDDDGDDRRHTDPGAADRARRVFEVQRARYRDTGILTARSEHQLAAEPYFVYDTIYSDGYFWNTITESGRYMPDMAAVSSKAAVSMFVLWRTPYTARLLRAVGSAFDPTRGIYEGIFEQGYGMVPVMTLNNNGIVLEALAYQVGGKLLPDGTGARIVATQACTSRLPACSPARRDP